MTILYVEGMIVSTYLSSSSFIILVGKLLRCHLWPVVVRSHLTFFVVNLFRLFCSLFSFCVCSTYMTCMMVGSHLTNIIWPALLYFKSEHRLLLVFIMIIVAPGSQFSRIKDLIIGQKMPPLLLEPFSNLSWSHFRHSRTALLFPETQILIRTYSIEFNLFFFDLNKNIFICVNYVKHTILDVWCCSKKM